MLGVVMPRGATAEFVRIACCQVRPVMGDVEGNRQLLRRAVRDAVAAGARLIVLPELCTTGYAFESADEARALGQRAGGGALSDWAVEAERGAAVVVGGFAEVDGSSVYNSAAVVDGSGVLAVYRKVHLWDSELRVFDRGEEPAPVVRTAVGMVGMSVCYDVFFPEHTRGLALDGADVIVAPTNAPSASSAAAVDNIGVSIARATAHVNRVFVAVCDRWGSERGIEWVGRSLIADPDGDVLAGPPGDREQLLVADCDFRRARDKRWPGTENDVLADRRPDLYRYHESPRGADERSITKAQPTAVPRHDCSEESNRLLPNQPDNPPVLRGGYALHQGVRASGLASCRANAG
jgi:predicted amidohydrolase